MVDAKTHAVSIVDTLPAGVTAIKAYGEGGGGSLGGSVGKAEGFPFPCSIEGQRVTCTYKEVLLSYERFMIAINVVLEPGSGTGVNEVGVSGGGAPTIVSRRALALETVPSYGTENDELSAEEEGGMLDTQAGSHPFQLTSTFTLNTRSVLVKHLVSKGEEEVVPEAQPVGIAKDLRFDLPAGLVGNPTPLPKCSLYVFVHKASECPDDTIVGVSTPIVTNTDISSNVPLAATVPLYSLEPAAGEPARFGFLEPVGPVILDTSVSPSGNDGGYKVVVSVPDAPDSEPVIGAQVTFWGVPADPRHDTTRGACLTYASTPIDALAEGEPSCPVQEKPQPFIVLPTSCTGPFQTSVESDSWEHIGEWTSPFSYSSQSPVGEPYGLDGCDRLNFEPSISVAPDGKQASTRQG